MSLWHITYAIWPTSFHRLSEVRAGGGPHPNIWNILTTLVSNIHGPNSGLVQENSAFSKEILYSLLVISYDLFFYFSLSFLKRRSFTFAIKSAPEEPELRLPELRGQERHPSAWSARSIFFSPKGPTWRWVSCCTQTPGPLQSSLTWDDWIARWPHPSSSVFHQGACCPQSL